MVKVYFSDTAYYIVGQDIEIYCSLVNAETDPIRRVYWAFLMILPELAPIKDNVTFYNDSRLIDDMGGYVTALDDWTREAKRIANQMLSSLYGIALYRKIEATQLSRMIDNGRTKMTDPALKENMINSMEQSWNKKHTERVRKLRGHFFGEKHA